MYTPTFKTTWANVPILSKADIDEIGEGLVGDFCPQALESPMEIDVDRFLTRYMGMTQDFQYLSSCNMYLGMTVFRDTNRVIVFNPERNCAQYISEKAGTVIIDNGLLAESQEHRYRFTVGHEAAHGVLHTPYFSKLKIPSAANDAGAPMVQCRADGGKSYKKPVTQWTDHDRMEWQANALASAILMPKSMVLKAAHDAEDNSSMVNAAHDAVVSIFNVSLEAAFYRLKEVGFVPGRDRACLPF